MLQIMLVREHWDGASFSTAEEVQITGSRTAPAAPMLDCPPFLPSALAGLPRGLERKGSPGCTAQQQGTWEPDTYRHPSAVQRRCEVQITGSCTIPAERLLDCPPLLPSALADVL